MGMRAAIVTRRPPGVRLSTESPSVKEVRSTMASAAKLLASRQPAISLCALLLMTAAAAQAPQSVKEGEGADLTYAVKSQLVQIYLTVTDRGKMVTGLSASDFLVKEDGHPKAIDRIDSGMVPLQVVLLFDVSESMRHALPVTREAAAYFIDSLRPGDRVTLVTFNNEIRAIPQLTEDRGPILKTIRSSRARGGTKLYEALLFAMKYLSDKEGRKAIVSFSDGEDTSRTASLQLVLNAAARYGYPIYTIGAGAGLNSAALKMVLRQIAEVNSGRMYFKEDPNDLRDAFLEVAGELRAAYVLNYYTQVPFDGRWHDVRISVANPSLKVHSRLGFYAREGGTSSIFADLAAAAGASRPAATHARAPATANLAAVSEVLSAPLPPRELDLDSLRASLPPSAAAQSKAPPKTVIRVDSHLVEVPVLLESISGRDIPKLSERDFRIYEDDSLREIAFFSSDVETQGIDRLREAAAKKAQAASGGGFSTAGRLDSRALLVGKTYLILDDLMTDATNFLRAKLETEKIIRENYRPQRPIVLHFTSQGSARLNSEESPDAMIQRVRRASPRSDSRLTTSDGIMSVYEAFLIERGEREATQLSELRYAASQQLTYSNSLGSVQGQMDGNPDMIRMTVQNLSHELVGENGAQLNRTLDGLEAIVTAATLEEGDFLKSMIFLSTGFSLGRTSGRADLGSRLDSIIARAKKGGVRISTVDVAGLSVLETSARSFIFGFLASNPHLQSLIERYPRDWKRDRESSLSQMASETKGRFLTSTNDLAGAARAAMRSAGQAYYLAYVSRQPTDGRFHRIRVTTSAGGVRTHARKGYFAGLQSAAEGAPEPDGESWEKTLEGVDRALKSGDFKQAASGLERLLRRFPNETSLWFNLGAARLRLGDAASAVEAFQKALVLSPEDRAVGRSLVQALVAAGYVEAAAEQMETLIRRHPRDLELMIQFGRVFEINGNIERAFGAYRRALDLNLAPPPDVFLLLARTAVSLRRDAEARIYIRDFLALGGDAAAIEPWRIRITEKPAQ